MKQNRKTITGVSLSVFVVCASKRASLSNRLIYLLFGKASNKINYYRMILITDTHITHEGKRQRQATDNWQVLKREQKSSPKYHHHHHHYHHRLNHKTVVDRDR